MLDPAPGRILALGPQQIAAPGTVGCEWPVPRRTEPEQHSQVSSYQSWAAGVAAGLVGDKRLSNVEAVLLASLPSMRYLIPQLMRAATLLSVAGLSTALVSQPAQAQRVVPKLGTICPLGYVDTLNGKCSTMGLANYTLQPTNGKACSSGWMNVGGGYCRKK